MPELDRVVIPVGDGTKMTLHCAAPPEGCAGPGIMVFQEAFGVNSHIRDVTARLAAEGYWAAAPELFHRTANHFEGNYGDFKAVGPHMQAVTTATIEADAQATHRWLISQSKVNRDSISAIGFCLGGRAAFVANAALTLRAAVSFYGGGIVPDLLPLAARQNAPILMCWGGLDKHITSDKARAIADALDQANKSHVQARFSDADHGFFCDERPQYQPRAAAEAWALTLAFLKNRV